MEKAVREVTAGTLPDVVTHNYDPRHGPFGNICREGACGALKVLDEIAASGVRRVKPDYLSRRLETEAWLRGEALRLLGERRLEHPIYFFLGDFADGDDPSRPASIMLPLSAFDRSVVTFTWPDSMASLPLGTRLDHAHARRPWHGKVFTLDRIGAAVAAHGMPERKPFGDPSTPDRFIEMQVWDERPLEPYRSCQSA